MNETAHDSHWFYTAFLSFVSFNVLNKLVFKVFPPPQHLHHHVRKSWLWGNIAISFIHSFITAVLSVYSLCKKPAMLEDMIYASNSIAYYTLGLSTGYFLYDFISIALNDAKNSNTLFIHHFIVIFAFIISLVNKKYIPFGLVALLMEVSSVFLHSRRLMRMSGIKTSTKLYQMNAIFLVVTFIIFRFVTCGWMLNFVVSHRGVLPTLHFTVGAAGVCILIPQNILLLKQVWTTDSKHEESSKKDKPKKTQQERHNVDGVASLKNFLRMAIAEATHATD